MILRLLTDSAFARCASTRPSSRALTQIALALLFAIPCVLLNSASAARAVTIDGTRVTLTIPDEFIAAEGFSGVHHHSENVAVVVSEIPSAYIKLIHQYADERLKKKNMKVMQRQNIEKDGLSGQLIHVAQKLKGKPFERWILITGDMQESIMIAGYYPKPKASVFSASIEDILRQAFWDSTRTLDHFDGLGYRIDDVPNLRIVSRMSNNLVFTKTGQLPDQYYTDALLMMGMKRQSEQQELTTEFAEYHFNHITLLENPQIEMSRQQNLNDLRSIVIEGTGRHKHLGYSVAALQMIIETDKGFLIAQGFTTPEDRENDFDVFYGTLNSFRLEDSN